NTAALIRAMLRSQGSDLHRDHALGYVLLNARHHYFERHRRPPPEVRLDPASSAVWFEGWKHRLWNPGDSPPRRREVAPAETWLLTKGWRRHRLIDPAEIPGRTHTARACG